MRLLRLRRDGPLGNPGFRQYFTAVSISLAGSAVAPVALTFAVPEDAGSAADIGWILASRAVPMVMFMLLGGAIADRFSRRGVLVIANGLSGVVQMVAASILISGNYSLAAILVCEVAGGTAAAFVMPAMRGVVPHLVQATDLQKANSLLASARNAAMIVGPSAAGLVTVVSGGGWAVAFDACTFLAAAALFARLSLPAPIRAAQGVLSDIAQGWHHFRRTTWLWSTIAAAAVANYLRTGIWPVLGPIIAAASFGAAGWGAVLSARAVGLLLMSVLMYRIRVARLLAFGQAAFAAGALPLIVLGLDLPLLVLVAAAFVSGIGSAVYATAYETTLQQNTPRDMLSRMAAYDATAAYITVPIGMATAVPIGQAFGYPTVAAAGGVLFLLATLAPLLSPAVRTITDPPATAGGNSP